MRNRLLSFVAALLATLSLAVADGTSWATVVELGIRYNKTDWAGLSTDAKPATARRTYGSTFYETDTGIQYVWTAAGWVVDARHSTMNAPRLGFMDQAADPTGYPGFYRNGATGKLRFSHDGTTWANVGTGSTGSWGDITGTLSDQTDLQAALDAKLTKDLLTGKGTLIGASAASTPVTIPAFTDGYFLQYDATATGGIKGVAVPAYPLGWTNMAIVGGVGGPTLKATPIDADYFSFADSASSNLWSYCTGTNLKAYLQTYFNGLYLAIDGVAAKATILATARNINGTSFNGSANVILSPAAGTIATAANIYPSSNGTAGGTKAQHFTVTALAETGTFYSPAGSWNDGDRLTIRIYAAAIQTLNFTTSAVYTPVGVILPTATVAGKLLYVGCVYNGVTSKWDVVSVSQEA